VLAVAAALLAGLAAAILGQSAFQAIVQGLIVGVGTFGAALGWSYWNAPAEIEAERQRVLGGWRRRFSVDANLDLPRRTVILRLFADQLPDLAGAVCEVESDGGQSWGPVPPSGGSALTLPVNKAESTWEFPKDFGGTLRAGDYTVRWSVRGHVEPIGVVIVTVN